MVKYKKNLNILCVVLSNENDTFVLFQIDAVGATIINGVDMNPIKDDKAACAITVLVIILGHILLITGIVSCFMAALGKMNLLKRVSDIDLIHVISS